MATSNTNLSLKLLIDKRANKVLFAEAGKDFVDFLFNLLALPIGNVIKLLRTANMVGCIGNLYESLENLNGAYIVPNQSKDSLLNPRITNPSPAVPLLLPCPYVEPPTNKLYACDGRNHEFYASDNPYVAESRNTKCPICSTEMNKEMNLIRKNASRGPTEGGYVKGLVTYMVTDDLSVSTISIISGVALFNKFNIKDFAALEEMVVEFGIDEGVELLKASLQSEAVLTSIFLEKKEVKDEATSSN